MLVLVMGLAVSPALASVDAVSMLETKAPRTPGCPDTLEIMSNHMGLTEYVG